MIVFVVGIKVWDELVKLSLIIIDLRGGFVVDYYLRINILDVYVIGECVFYKGEIWGLIVLGVEMVDIFFWNLIEGLYY